MAAPRRSHPPGTCRLTQHYLNNWPPPTSAVLATTAYPLPGQRRGPRSAANLQYREDESFHILDVSDANYRDPINVVVHDTYPGGAIYLGGDTPGGATPPAALQGPRAWLNFVRPAFGPNFPAEVTDSPLTDPGPHPSDDPGRRVHNIKRHDGHTGLGIFVMISAPISACTGTSRTVTIPERSLRASGTTHLQNWIFIP